jgi:hypothetical protein
MNATASLVTFALSIAPLTPTGCAAPITVLGAIAFSWQAIMMKVPAEAARAPEGPVQHSTGTFEAWMALTMVRIDESSPPGVSMRIATAASPSRPAASMPAFR